MKLKLIMATDQDNDRDYIVLVQHEKQEAIRVMEINFTDQPEFTEEVMDSIVMEVCNLVAEARAKNIFERKQKARASYTTKKILQRLKSQDQE